MSPWWEALAYRCFCWGVTSKVQHGDLWRCPSAPYWPPGFTGEEGKCPRRRQHGSAAQWMTRNEKCWAGGGKGKGGLLLAASRPCQIQCQEAHGLRSPGLSASPRDAGKRWLNTLTHSLHFRSPLPSFISNGGPKTGNHSPPYSTVNLFLLSTNSGPRLTHPGTRFGQWVVPWALGPGCGSFVSSLTPGTESGMQKLLHWYLGTRGDEPNSSLQCDSPERRSHRLCQKNKQLLLVWLLQLRHHFTHVHRRSLYHDGYRRATADNNHKGERCNRKPHAFFFPEAA